MNKLAKQIKEQATAVRSKIQRRSKPTLSFPLRALSNVTYQPKRGFLQLKGKKKTRTLTVATVKTFAQTLRMMSQAKTLVEDDEIMTKREAYYVSKNWDEARFDEQPESDTVIDDIEALFEVNREQLGFIPEEKGGEVAGKLSGFGQDLIQREHLVDDSHPPHFTGRNRIPGKQQFGGIVPADLSRQVNHMHRRNQAHVDFRVTELGGFAGDDHVARHGPGHPCGFGRRVDSGNGGFAEPVLGLMHLIIKHLDEFPEFSAGHGQGHF